MYTNVLYMEQGGSIEVSGETLAGDDLMLKRGFNGDEEVYEAAVSEDGKLMVVLDTRQDEKVTESKCQRKHHHAMHMAHMYDCFFLVVYPDRVGE